MPAAAPQATSSGRELTGIGMMRAIKEASSAPSWTIEPSRPTEPPLTMLASEEKHLARVRRKSMRPSPTTAASM